MEYWDIYDYYGKKKNKKAIRGSKLNDTDYHIVINAWIVNSKGEFLITQRSAKKSHPLMWECTGGSALMGETSLQAAKREVQEELGITVDDKEARLIGITRRFYKGCPDIFYVWLFKKDISLKDVIIQKEEVNDVMWASKSKIIELFDNNKFEANAFFDKIINLDNKQSYYYLGFNANNAICNEDFFDGMVTLNPNNTKGNIFYTEASVKNKNSEFLVNYKKYLLNTMKNLTAINKNTIFLAFNKKIKDLLCDVNGYNIIGEKDYNLIDSINDKKIIRNILKNDIPVINTQWIDKKINYNTALSIVKSKLFVIQGKIGAGGNNTFLIDNEEKFNKYSNLCDNKYFISDYIEHLPLNSTIIISEHRNLELPSSVQLISLKNDRFNYVGADFIYYQTINEKIKNKIATYNNIIALKLKEMGYKGILGIDYIVDKNDNVYFMEINPRFQSSSFLISKYLSKYCSTTIAELHYMAINDIYIGSNYIEKIDNSFLNCYKKSDYSNFKMAKILKEGYFYKNKSSNFRKIFNYSILKHGDFQKRTIDE